MQELQNMVFEIQKNNMSIFWVDIFDIAIFDIETVRNNSIARNTKESEQMILKKIRIFLGEIRDRVVFFCRHL